MDGTAPHADDDGADDPALPVSVPFDAFVGTGERDPAPRVPGSAFYTAPAPPTGPGLAWTLPAHPARFGSVLAVLGLLGTFLIPFHNLLYDIHHTILGAPVFEEFLKFGVALILVTLLRFHALPLRVLVALAPGVGFGLFEHWFAYAEEDLLLFTHRVIFHALTPAISIVAYEIVRPFPDARLHWFAALPAILVHWLNNYLAVMLIPVALFAPATAQDAVDMAFVVVVNTIVVAVFLVLVFRGSGLRPWVAHTWETYAPRLPPAITSPAAVTPDEAGAATDPGEP